MVYFKRVLYATLTESVPTRGRPRLSFDFQTGRPLIACTVPRLGFALDLRGNDGSLSVYLSLCLTRFARYTHTHTRTRRHVHGRATRVSQRRKIVYGSFTVRNAKENITRSTVSRRDFRHGVTRISRWLMGNRLATRKFGVSIGTVDE